MKRFGTLTVFGLVVALSGCGSAPAPSARDTITPTLAPTATGALSPAPTAVVATRPTLDDLTLSFDGLGPLRLGDDPRTYDPDVSIVEREDDACGVAGFVRWNAAYPDRPLSDTSPGNTMRAFSVGWAEDVGVQAIQTLSPRIKTSAGITVGSSFESLELAYPGLEPYSTGSGRDRYSVAGSPGTMYFDVGNGQSEHTAAVVNSMLVVEASVGAGVPSNEGC